MPITINNSLPSVSLHFGIPEDNENRMQIRVDTRDVMNSGYSLNRMRVMSQYPKMVN